MKKNIPKLDAEESKLLTKVMTLGAGTSLPIVMSPTELAKLIGVVFRDVGKLEQLEKERPSAAAKILPSVDYYSLPDNWFVEPIQLDEFEHVELMRLGSRLIPDFVTYLRCLSELHKRRRKYAKIMSAQPIPTMVQVSPRALVEYGRLQDEVLASWLTWRKFFYDLDNRSAQETGYLFEPVLAAAIGGEPKNSRSKVVRRTADQTKGRQVDCWKVRPDGKPLAYEFKLRVTIAASGQGRFCEELQFAEDCANSGAVPVLVVLDPTPNARLSDLHAQFKAKGGYAYIGDSAWTHLEEEAGDVMAIFLERYVRQPISAISAFEVGANDGTARKRNQLLDFGARFVNGDIVLRFGDHERLIQRIEDAGLESDDESQADDGEGEE